jgi:hypothetical protein
MIFNIGSNQFKQKAFAVSACLVITCGIFLLHTLPLSNSMINFENIEYNQNKELISEDYINDLVHYHKTNPEFAKRIVNTFLIEKTSSLIGISIGNSFVLVNFIFLFVSGIILYILSFLISKRFDYSITSVLLYYSNFGIIFLYFPPIYSYSEPLQFTLLFVVLFFLLKKQLILSVMVFTIAMFTRESSIIIFPALLFYLFKEYSQNHKKLILSILYFIVSIVLYVTYLLKYVSSNITSIDVSKYFMYRLEAFHGNFGDLLAGNETMFSLFLVVFPLVYILIYYLCRFHLRVIEKKLVLMFIITLTINTCIVILMTKAREARLFFLPLVLLLPIIGNFFLISIRRIKISRLSLVFKLWHFWFLFLLNLFICYLIACKIYRSSIMDYKGEFFNEYMFILLVCLSTHVLMKTYLKYYKKTLTQK